MPSFRNVKIGADPELFIIDTTGRRSRVVSAIGLIKGEKGNPYRNKMWPEGYGTETDNILAEFNIPPVETKRDFIHHINFMKDRIREIVKSYNPAFDIQCAASKVVDDDQLQSEQAKEFGCDIDFNAYTEAPNEKPKGELTNLRSAGFHIHMSYDNYNTEDSLLMIKVLDIFLGLMSVFYDRDKKRRSLYGKAGCFRLTDYGLEYRVLSSKMMSTDQLLEKVWAGTTFAVEFINNEYRPDIMPDGQEVVKAINSGSIDKAKAIFEALGAQSGIVRRYYDVYVKTEE